MRQIVVDTETTGLEVETGHRIIEIGCVELLNRRRSGNDLHLYLNPERQIDAGASAVHGIDAAFLVDKPRFAQVAKELREYLGEADLIIHNAPFDLGFLDAEYRLLDPAAAGLATQFIIIDTLVEARSLHPGQRNSLDALCKRYRVDDSARDRHGALLDAQLLAEVYLAMTGGQKDILFAAADGSAAHSCQVDLAATLAAGGRPRVLTATQAEQDAHRAYLGRLAEASGGNCLWYTLGPAPINGDNP